MLSFFNIGKKSEIKKPTGLNFYKIVKYILYFNVIILIVKYIRIFCLNRFFEMSGENKESHKNPVA